MRLQPWTTRRARRNKAEPARATGLGPSEVTTHLYDALVALYSPLDPSKQELRTITLIPAEFENDIYCELHVVSLLDNPAYEALSYAWGDHRPSRKIFIDGSRHQVSQNLESALRHLRYRDRPRTLWVDALCINQTDIEERNSQVKHMGSVYGRASEVLAWLGPEYNDSDLAFDFFQTMPSDPELHWDPQRYPELKSVYTLQHTRAVNDLFVRPWWRRVWTVQESVLGPKLRFVCGSRQILADQAFGVGACYFKHLYTCCQDIWYSIFYSTAGQPGLGDVCDALAKLAEMRAHNDKYRFGQILSKFMPRHCSDPHDKIYGLLGLASQTEASLINPDYSKPAAQLYEEVALVLIEISGELDILSMQFPKATGEVGPAVQGIASWVPNWTLDNEPSSLHDLDDRLSCLSTHNASKDSRANVQRLATGRLSVRGSQIARVDTLSQEENHLDAASLSTFFNSWKEMLDITTDPLRLYANSTSTTVDDAFWQTLCCAVIPDRNEPRNNDLLHPTSDSSPHKPWFDAWWEWCDKHDCNPQELMSIQSRYSRAEINAMGGLVSTSICMRRLFRSDGVGWMGLVPMDAKVGDLVVLLGGGRVPYILRPSGVNQADSNENQYSLVGDAYVHGIMDGSEWREDKVEEFVLI